MRATGDFVYRIDGRVFFKGRVDRRVKIAGQQVQLEIVEDVFQASGLLKACAVLTCPPTGVVEYLVAFVVPLAESSDHQGVSTRLRQFAAGRLADRVAIPSIVEVCGQLPVTRNGKVPPSLPFTRPTVIEVDASALMKEHLARSPVLPLANLDPGALTKFLQRVAGCMLRALTFSSRRTPSSA